MKKLQGHSMQSEFSSLRTTVYIIIVVCLFVFGIVKVIGVMVS